MGSRSKGPNREVVQYRYHHKCDAGPVGESKLERRVRRSKRERFGRALEKQFAVSRRRKQRKARRK